MLLHEDHACPIVAVNLWYHVGSKNETPGRTGFAHLFEHLMFEGSQHHDKGYFPPLQGAGASLNGSTNADRTNYWEVVPSNALELALWMESDRMGFLLPALTDAKFSNQRDVVLNERRQNYENRPYGLAPMAMLAALFPPDHPYHWTTIGEIADLQRRQARRRARVLQHATTTRPTRRWRSPATSTPTRRSRWRAPTSRTCRRARRSRRCGRPTPALAGETRLLLEDRVELPRLYLAWHDAGDVRRTTTPSSIWRPTCSPTARPRGSIARLVYDQRIATDVSAAQNSREIAGFVQVARDRGARATRSPSWSGRSSTRSRGWRPKGRPTTRSSAAGCRPKRSSCSGCRPSAASAASPIS